MWWSIVNYYQSWSFFLLKMTRNHWPFLPLGRIYSWPLATLRAFWSLEPQAYLVKTIHQQIIRPHFAVSTCCTLVSTAACWKVHSCEKCLLVQLCAWFWPESAKRLFKHLELFSLEWKRPWASLLQHHLGYGMIVAIQYKRSCHKRPAYAKPCVSEIPEKCQLLPVRISSLFEQNVLKAVGWTQIKGSCQMYAGTMPNWKDKRQLQFFRIVPAACFELLSPLLIPMSFQSGCVVMSRLPCRGIYPWHQQNESWTSVSKNAKLQHH